MTRRRFFPWTRPGYRLLDNFARASALRERHGRFGAASSRNEPNRLDEIRYLMKLAERDAIEAGAPRPAYGFAAHDVADILTDASARVFFRLHDGRVFSDQGEPEGRDLTDLHGAEPQ